MIFEPTGSKAWETGSYEQGTIGIGSIAFAMVNLTIQSYFTMEIRGSARPTSGNNAHRPSSKSVANTLRC